MSDLALVAEMSSSGRPHRFATGALKVNITTKRQFGIALLFATGSEKHLEELRRLADSKGLSLTSQGLCRGGKVIASQTETGIYEALGMPFIPPELREGRDEIALAQRKRLPKLVEEQDIKGILHAHTQASDGVNTLEQMAEATRGRGYTYFGVADHSQSAGYAGGLSVEEIEEQHKEIDRLNQPTAPDSTFSRASRLTFCRMVPSTIPTTSWSGSILSWLVFTAASNWIGLPRPHGLFER